MYHQVVLRNIIWLHQTINFFLFFDILRKKLRELSYLNSGIEISLRDERNSKAETFKSDGVLVEFVEFKNKNKTPLNKTLDLFKNKQMVYL